MTAYEMSISDWSSDVCSSDLADAESGKLTESFACGTAAVVTPVGKVTRGEASFTICAGGPGQVTTMLKDRLVGIQRGDRKSVEEGKRVSVCVEPGGRSLIKKNNQQTSSTSSPYPIILK